MDEDLEKEIVILLDFLLQPTVDYIKHIRQTVSNLITEKH